MSYSLRLTTTAQETLVYPYKYRDVYSALEGLKSLSYKDYGRSVVLAEIMRGTTIIRTLTKESRHDCKTFKDIQDAVQVVEFRGRNNLSIICEP